MFFLSNTLLKHHCDYSNHVYTIDSKPMQPKECKIKIEYDVNDVSENELVNDSEKQTNNMNTDNVQLDAKAFNTTELPHISG